jgi:hypothetical protein
MKLELKKIELPEIPEELKTSHDMIQNVMSRLYTDLLKKVDEAMEEGLRLKGFEFENRIELIEFIKTRCRCEDRVDVKERVYYVDDIPFFLHSYGGEMDLKPTTEGRSYIMAATYGGFAYL